MNQPLNELFDGSRVLISLIFLIYASWSDFKTREVSNWVWAIFAPLAFSLTALQYILFPQDLLYSYVLPFIVTLALSLVLFYTGGFGGADAKALICLSLALPNYPIYLLESPIGYFPLLFPLSVFLNSVFLASFSVVYVLLRSFLWKYRTKKKLFEGFEKESLGRKILVLLSGYKVNIAELEKKNYLYPLEDFDARLEEKRQLIAIPKDEEREEIVSRFIEAKRLGQIEADIWATPGLPMLVFITAGFVIALVFGDILWTLLRLIL
jgi:preflagellin peptidase FlaK